MLAHAIAEIRVWEFFLDPDLIAANDRPQTAANDGFYGDLATFVYENTVGKLFWTRYYQYAEDGNRLVANSTTGDDPEGPYSHEYDHDAHGNMISMPHLSSMIWNHDDEMQEVAVGSETVYFQYAGGNRTRKFVEKTGTITEERIYLGAFEIFRKRISGDIDVERESLHISDGTGRILLIETLTIDEGDPVTTPVGMWRYQLSNHIGSASTEINEDGDVISHEEYHPYGTSAYRAVDASIEVSARRYRYGGMERDDETGLGYHTARYYASWLGRWTASDPIGLAGGGNRFEYVGGNPVSKSDPNGSAPPSANDTDWVLPGTHPSAQGGQAAYVGAGHPESTTDIVIQQISELSAELAGAGPSDPLNQQRVEAMEILRAMLPTESRRSTDLSSFAARRDEQAEWSVVQELHFEGRKPITAKAAGQHLGVLALGTVVGLGVGAVLAPVAGSVSGALFVGAGSGGVGGFASGAAGELIHQNETGLSDPMAVVDAAALEGSVGAALGLVLGGGGRAFQGRNAIPKSAAGPTRGVGRIHYYSPESLGSPMPHYSLETSGARTLRTHQVVRQPGPSGSTAVVPAAGLPKPTTTVTFEVPNIQAAQSAQRAQMGRTLAPYNVRTNSCLTTACDPLRAGGVEIPEAGTMDFARWARSNFGSLRGR